MERFRLVDSTIDHLRLQPRPLIDDQKMDGSGKLKCSKGFENRLAQTLSALKAKEEWGKHLKSQPVPASLMLADGIYSVHFETPLGQGSGVVVVTGKRLRGGDATFAYFGTIKHTKNGFTAEIETKRHSQGRDSVFNREPVHIHLVGKSDGLNAVCTGTAAEVPGLIFKAVLNFISEWGLGLSWRCEAMGSAELYHDRPAFFTACSHSCLVVLNWEKQKDSE
jgi:hypothetical protein